jgi:hypothetical protein
MEKDVKSEEFDDPVDDSARPLLTFSGDRTSQGGRAVAVFDR